MEKEVRKGYYVDRPNRRKAAVKAGKYVVVLLLLISVALMLAVALGGWNALEGAKGMLIGYMLVYLILAFYALRWSRGTLPLSAALGIILLIFAAIAGPEWFARDKRGFTDPTFNESVLGTLTLLLVPVQVLLIGFAMSAFRQDWNVEIERRLDDDDGGRRNRGRDRIEPDPSPA